MYISFSEPCGGVGGGFRCLSANECSVSRCLIASLLIVRYTTLYLQVYKFKSNQWNCLRFQLIVYGAGQVIPKTLKTIKPNLKYSILVNLSPIVEYGRVVLVTDKGLCTDAVGNQFTRTTNSSFLLHFV